MLLEGVLRPVAGSTFRHTSTPTVEAGTERRTIAILAVHMVACILQSVLECRLPADFEPCSTDAPQSSCLSVAAEILPVGRPVRYLGIKFVMP